jgi:Poly A polymerase head domain
MTQSSARDDLRALYKRATDAPVAAGDRIHGRRVIGFCLRQGVDQILIEGEEGQKKPPDRPLPCRGGLGGLERTGLSPVAGLPADRIETARPYLWGAFEGLFDSREDGQFVRGLLEEIAALGHLAWLVGGAVRDLLASGPDARVNDFDVAGTIGPGCLDAMIRLRRRCGIGDYKTSISAGNVWSVTPREQPEPRLVEYKPLARTAFRFPVWGGSLGEDAATRDLTINALYYDRQFDVLTDPCGEGRAHLDGRVMATPLRVKDPVEQASIILRCLKFRLRWPELDITAMVEWINDLTGDLVTQIPESKRKGLVSKRNRCVPREFRGTHELAIAAEFGEKAVRLVEQIQAWDKTRT